MKQTMIAAEVKTLNPQNGLIFSENAPIRHWGSSVTARKVTNKAKPRSSEPPPSAIAPDIQGAVMAVSIISIALLNDAGDRYAIATTERTIGGGNP